MDIVFITVLFLIFLAALLLGIFKNSISFLIVAAIISIIIGGVLYSTGVERITGTNSTISDDNRSVEHKPLKSEMDRTVTNAIGTIFFILAIGLILITATNKNK